MPHKLCAELLILLVIECILKYENVWIHVIPVMCNTVKPCFMPHKNFATLHIASQKVHLFHVFSWWLSDRVSASKVVSNFYKIKYCFQVRSLAIDGQSIDLFTQCQDNISREICLSLANWQQITQNLGFTVRVFFISIRKSSPSQTL